MGRDHEPRPAFGLLGCSQCGRGPAESVLDKPVGVLDVKTAQIGAPTEIEVGFTPIVDVYVKAEFIRRLMTAGPHPAELTSFVSAKWAPQRADAEDLLRILAPMPGRHSILPCISTTRMFKPRRVRSRVPWDASVDHGNGMGTMMGTSEREEGYR